MPPERRPKAMPIEQSLESLRPVSLEWVQSLPLRRRVGQLLMRYHYRGFNGAVGENVQYLARDHRGRELAVMVFGAAAWKVAVRDQFIGWSVSQRQQRLSGVANQQRFLILPWVRVPYLASHLLALATRGLAADWQARYGHRIWLVETFVELDRFAGTSYRAVGWRELGLTTGRTLQRAITLAFGIRCGVGKRTVTRAISTDDTRVWRNGKHVPDTQWHRDPLGPPFQTNLRWGHRFLQASLVLPLYLQDGQSSSRSIPIRFEMAPTVKKPGKRATENDQAEYRRLKKEQNLSVQFVNLTREVRYKELTKVYWQGGSRKREVRLLVAMYSWLLLAGLKCHGPTRTEVYEPLPKWRRGAKRPSCQDLVTLPRRQLTEKPLQFPTAQAPVTAQAMAGTAAA
jgi:hypothetical protein